VVDCASLPSWKDNITPRVRIPFLAQIKLNLKIMSSQNKKRKERNCYSYHGMALKMSNMKLKRLLYFNASNRRKNNKFEIE
jgi:hypothetical protein